MAIVYNATNEHLSVKAHGNWFSFKPKQFKVMNEDLAGFLTSQRAEDGLVYLPEEFADPAYATTSEGREQLEKATKEGVSRFIAKLKEIVNNNLISLKKDLQMQNIQTDPRAFMSDGEMKALELLDKYQAAGKDEQQARVDRVRELEKQMRLDEESEE